MRRALLVLAWMLLGACGDAGEPHRPPNVLVFLVDTTRADHLSAYGYERATSPSVERLAAGGVLFERAFAPSSWTRASTASLLTGLDPVHHGARSRDQRVAPEATLLAEHLAGAGYQCAAIVTNPHVTALWGFDRGCATFEDVGASTESWQDADANVVLEHVVRRLDELAADPRPFFLYVHTIDPHGPNTPPAPYDRLFTSDPRPAPDPGELLPGTPTTELDNLRALYDAEIRFADQAFGRLLDELERRGLFEDTLIVFTSDHGEEHLEHGRGGHGQQLFQELVRVPLVIKFPRGRWAGRRPSARASLLDVVPTILAALALEAAGPFDGVDLSAAIEAAPSPSAWDPASAWEERPLFLDLDLVRHDGELHRAQGVVRGRYKYIQEEEPQARRFLFDLVADPLERVNRIESEVEVAEELAGLVRAWHGAREAGLHLRVASDSEAGGPVTVRVRVTVLGGRVAGLRASELEEEDIVRQEMLGTRMQATLVLREGARELAQRLPQDVDELVLRVEPPGATVRVEAFEVEGGSLPLFLGAGQAVEDESWPLEVSAASEAYPPPAMGGARGRLAPGRYLWNQPRPEGVREVPAELRERLEGLGYAGDF